MEASDLSTSDLIKKASQLLDQCFDLDALLEVTFIISNSGYNMPVKVL